MGTSPAMVPTDIEARAMRKMRTRIIPFVFVLFVVNFLDRANIAFAALTMNKELAITSQQYGFLAGIFFLGYFIFEIPSNLMPHKLGNDSLSRGPTSYDPCGPKFGSQA
jgi:MFS transporter, ACS family, tartrate transporter